MMKDNNRAREVTNIEHIIGRCAGRVCAAHALLDDTVDYAFEGCARLEGLFMDKPDKAAVALEWMEQNYDTMMYVCNAVIELLDDASTALADLPVAPGYYTIFSK